MVSRRSALAQRFSPPKDIRTKTFQAPIAGWVTADSLIASRPNSAQILENYVPTSRGARLRGGQIEWSDIGAPAKSMMIYNVSNNAKFFAASETKIHDITVGDSPSDAVIDQTAGYYSYVNFSTAGGYFLIAVNGQDPMLIFDGTDWFQVTDVSTPYAITSADPELTIDTSRFIHVGVYRNRLYFVESGTLNVWYLPVNSIAGAASTFNLAGVFGQGGSLLYVANWSLDAGNGLDAKLVIMSTEGEVAVYQGTNPSDADTWTIVGEYKVTRPMGPRCTMRAGGDLILGCAEGLVPISVAVSKDAAALSLASISAAIEPDWLAESGTRQNLPWEIAKWPQRNMAVISLPTDSEVELDQFCFVVNLETGAWCKFTGWDTQCLEIFEDQLFIGTRDGLILQGDVGGDDNGTPYYPVCAYNWDDLGAPGYLKTVMEVRATFRTASEIIPDISMSADYTVALPIKPNAPTITAVPSLWDVGNWDEAIWDDGTVLLPFSTGWLSVGMSGTSVAMQIQQTCSGILPPTAEYIEMTITYELGGLVV